MEKKIIGNIELVQYAKGETLLLVKDEHTTQKIALTPQELLDLQNAIHFIRGWKKQSFYRGKGEHSVKELENMIEELKFKQII